MRFASSHCSKPSLSPSPQVVAWQTDLGGVPVFTQAKPGSSVHVALQPSLETVLPSSHCSLPASTPSPHMGTATAVQGPPLPPTLGQVKPASTIVQSAVHPSPPIVLPSSHASPGSMWALPQTQMSTHGTPGD